MGLLIQIFGVQRCLVGVKIVQILADDVGFNQRLLRSIFLRACQGGDKASWVEFEETGFLVSKARWKKGAASTNLGSFRYGLISTYLYGMCFSSSVIHARWTKGQNHPEYRMMGSSFWCAETIPAAEPVATGWISASGWDTEPIFHIYMCLSYLCSRARFNCIALIQCRDEMDVLSLDLLLIYRCQYPCRSSFIRNWRRRDLDAES